MKSNFILCLVTINFGGWLKTALTEKSGCWKTSTSARCALLIVTITVTVSVVDVDVIPVSVSRLAYLLNVNVLLLLIVLIMGLRLHHCGMWLTGPTWITVADRSFLSRIAGTYISMGVLLEWWQLYRSSLRQDGKKLLNRVGVRLTTYLQG